MAQVVEQYRWGADYTRKLVYDTDTPGQFGIYTEVDMDQVLATNHALRSEGSEKPFATNKLVARVPMTIYEQSVREGWDDADWKKFLNDPDNALFRVWQGRV